MLAARDSSTRNLVVVLVTSIAISVSSLVLVYAFHYEPNLSRAWTASFLLAALWLLLLNYAIKTFGKRSLWLLLGAPPVLWVIFVFVGIFACGLWTGGCP